MVRCFKFRNKGLRYGRGLGFRVYGSWFIVYGLGSRVKGKGFRVKGIGIAYRI
jgi:hypothetical protein